ncbi:MAG: methenyltetrahydromethanopterin cyclohydrolase, partial [Nitrososphaerales archaeon]
MSVSVNKIAFKIVQEMINKSVELGIIVEKVENEATIIDAGIKARGGYLAGKYMTEVCLGGLADVSLTLANYGGLTLPTICVASDYPSIALLGSQYAGWRI